MKIQSACLLCIVLCGLCVAGCSRGAGGTGGADGSPAEEVEGDLQAPSMANGHDEAQPDAAARSERSPHPDWIDEVRERIHAVFAGMDGDFHRERLEMRLEAAERLAAIQDRTLLEDTELDEFRFSFDEAFSMWERDPLNPAVKAVELNLADFGAKGDGVTDDFEAFALAVGAVRRLGGAPSILRIPAGDYLIDSVAPGHVLARSAFHFDLSGITNCAVIGEAPETTRIEFGAYGKSGISLDASENCSLVALDLSWRKAPFMQAVFESYEPSDHSAVVRHHRGTLLPTELDPEDGHTHVGALFSQNGKYIMTRGNYYVFLGRRKAEDLGGGRFRLWFDEKVRWGQDIRDFAPAAGDILCMVDRFYCACIRTDASSYSSFHRIWIRNAPSQAFAGNVTARYTTMDHCRVFPKSPDLMLSSNADTGFCPVGSHIAHCEYRNMSDDGANCLGRGLLALRREGARSLVIQPPRGRLRIGDFQQIVGPNGRICDLRVEDIRIVQEDLFLFPGTAMPTRDRWIVTYDSDLPDDVRTEADCGKGKADIVFTPLEWGVGFTMHDNYIHDFRGRGACLQCSHAIIDGNVFENMLSGINVAGRLAPMEGPISSDALLRHNIIRDTRIGILVFYMDLNGLRPEEEKWIRRIEIVSNRFENVATPYSIKNAEDVVMRDNFVE